MGCDVRNPAPEDPLASLADLGWGGGGIDGINMMINAVGWGGVPINDNDRLKTPMLTSNNVPLLSIRDRKIIRVKEQWNSCQNRATNTFGSSGLP